MARIRDGGPAKHKKKLDPDAIAKALASNPRGIVSGLLLNSLIECFGGAGAFARAIYAEFAGSKVGSLQRTKILEMIARLTIVTTSQELAKPRRAEDMSDEELAEQAERLIRRLRTKDDGPAPAPTTPAAPGAEA